MSRSALDLAGMAGLTDAEAAARLQRDGPNELPAAHGRGVLGIALEVAREPMFLMLVVQERRTERALDALRDLSSPRALVIRDGAQRRIAGRDVVRGDLVVLLEEAEGGRELLPRRRPAPHVEDGFSGRSWPPAPPRARRARPG